MLRTTDEPPLTSVSLFILSSLSPTGGHHFPYPKWVWSPSGGWWPKPVHWQRNTAIYAVVMAMSAAWLYQNAEAKTIAYHPKVPPKSAAHHDEHH